MEGKNCASTAVILWPWKKPEFSSVTTVLPQYCLQMIWRITTNSTNNAFCWPPFLTDITITFIFWICLDYSQQFFSLCNILHKIPSLEKCSTRNYFLINNIIYIVLKWIGWLNTKLLTGINIATPNMGENIHSKRIIDLRCLNSLC